MCEILPEESADTRAAAVEEIGETRQVPFQRALHPNPFRISTEAILDPRVLGMPDCEHQRFPSKGGMAFVNSKPTVQAGASDGRKGGAKSRAFLSIIQEEKPWIPPQCDSA